MQLSSDPFGYNANALRQRRREPVSAQGEITGKAFVDYVEIATRKEQSNDAFTLQQSYPGGGEDDNHTVMPGELVFGLRTNSNVYLTGGEPNEYGITGMAGLYYGMYESDDAVMRDYYFMGIAKTEFRVGNPDQPEHGFSFLRAGSFTTTNNGPMDIHAGDLVGYRFPLRPGSTQYESQYGRDQRNFMPHVTVGNNMDRIVPQNKPGVPNTKYLPELVPFDYTDFQTSTAGALINMQRDQTKQPNSGCRNVPFSKLIEPGPINVRNRDLTEAQEEAMGYRYGLAGVVLRGAQALVRAGMDFGNGTDAEMSAIADAIGLFPENKVQGADDKILLGMIAHIFAHDQMHQGTLYDRVKTGLSDLKTTPGVSDEYKQLVPRVMTLLCGGIASSWYHKSNRIVGKAMNGSRPTEMCDLVVGHWRRI